MIINFGDPEPVMKQGFFLEYADTYLINGYYEPPVSMRGLSQSFYANSVHSSAIFAKRDMVVATVELSDKISKADFKRLVLEFLIFGSGYIERVKNRLGQTVRYNHLPSMNMRRREKHNCYSWKTWNQKIDYKEGSVFQISEYSPTQEIYGVPQYLAALSSIWLNEDATLFRRKYYRNGAHSGFLLYMNNPNLTSDQEDEIKSKLEGTRGLGNFRNLFINGKGKDGEKPELIPVGQINAKDEFANMKSVTTGDILSAHRIPLDLMSVVREGFASSGDLNKVDRLFYKNGLVPIVNQLMELNDWAKEELIKLKPYEAMDA